MASSERKDLAIEAQEYELPSFYKMTDGITSHMKVELDALSKRLILRGRANGIPGEETKSALGQRYVMVGFIKENIVHLRAIPGFGFIADEAKREETAKKAMAFFNCDRDHVAFSDHQIWTGVVHQQIISLIQKKEPKLVAGAKVIAFSIYKKSNYTWLNRSVLNATVFPANPLAVACYAFDEKITEKRPEFDLLYHLTRSIPMDFFREIVNAGTEIICEKELAPLAHSSLDECTNTAYEIKWKALQELFKTNKPQAIEKIQHLLMRNLHILLSNLSSPHYIAQAQEILIEGIKYAEQNNIPIDIDFIPPEFKEDTFALTKAKETKNSEMISFLTGYKARCLYRDFYAAINGKNQTEIDLLMKKSLDIEEFFHTYILNLYMECDTVIVLNYLFTTTSENTEKFIRIACNIFILKINQALFEKAEKYIKFLASKTTLPVIKAFFKGILDNEAELLSLFAEILMEDKPNFDKKNAAGKTLLHIAVDNDDTRMVRIFADKSLVNLDVLDENGNGCLIKATRDKQWFIASLLLQGSINVEVKDEHGKSPLDYALDYKKLDVVILLLVKGATLPIKFVLGIDSTIYDIFRYLYYDGRLNPLMQIIKKQKNTFVQIELLTTLLGLVTETLTEVPTVKTISKVMDLLTYSSLPLDDALIKLDLKKYSENFIFFLKRLDSKEQECCIDRVLNKDCAFGMLLLKTAPSLKLFDKIQSMDFCEILKDMKAKIMQDRYQEKEYKDPMQGLIR